MKDAHKGVQSPSRGWRSHGPQCGRTHVRVHASRVHVRMRKAGTPQQWCAHVKPTSPCGGQPRHNLNPHPRTTTASGSVVCTHAHTQQRVHARTRTHRVRRARDTRVYARTARVYVCMCARVGVRTHGMYLHIYSRKGGCICSGHVRCGAAREGATTTEGRRSPLRGLPEAISCPICPRSPRSVTWGC